MRPLARIVNDGPDGMEHDAKALLALPEAEHLRYLLASLRGAALAVLRRPCGDRRRGDALIELEKWCELTAHVDDPR